MEKKIALAIFHRFYCYIKLLCITKILIKNFNYVNYVLVYTFSININKGIITNMHKDCSIFQQNWREN